MKKMKNMITMLAATALLLAPLNVPLKASAAEPVTYTVKYMEDTKDWRYRTDSSEFEDPNYYREVDVIPLKDGDIVAVYCDVTTDEDPKLDLGNARLSNLTVTQSPSFLIIQSGDIDECFLLSGSSCSINGNVSTAYVYEKSFCNFNKNVKDLRFISGDEETHSNIGCSGTVGHFSHIDFENNIYDYNLYNFAANTFSLQDGILQTAEEHYSQTPTQGTAPVTPPAPQQTSQPSSTPSDEYDSVPKTGQRNFTPWLLVLGTACVAGCVLFSRKKAH